MDIDNGIDTTEGSHLSWRQVWDRRMARHGLTGVPSPGTASPAPTPSRVADVVAAMCGAHAQVMSAAELSIGARLGGGTRADVRAALDGAEGLVKTYGPRGTVHLLAARDLPMWTGALSALPSGPNGLPQASRLTDRQTEEVVAAVAVALADAGDEGLTAEELSDAVVAATGPWAGDLVMPAFQGMWPRWRQALHLAAHRGALCFGPDRGRKATYLSPERRLPGFRPAPADEALHSLVARYLHAYGPATPRQFAQWLGAPPVWAAALFDTLAAAGSLRPVDVEGSTGWLNAADDQEPDTETPAAGTLRLLPYFDAYVVGCHPRDQLFPGPAAARALSRTGQAGNYPVLLVDGTVAGVWHLRRSGRTADLTVEPLARLSAARRRALDEEAARIGAFLDTTTLRVTVGPVTVGPHA
ncbi:winged helix DNA-binding domain-containing protein [Streptomyces alboflavus]|uniref:winged helix DNA-binding domain-containing protein n=1 Tax=Streptomyces alboflavus TaxID=67267 RepID=UPI0004C24E69|nr:winged helix DNA-binding domain-containing protein [Streptomyces alboflavus]